MREGGLSLAEPREDLERVIKEEKVKMSMAVMLVREEGGERVHSALEGEVLEAFVAEDEMERDEKAGNMAAN